MSFARKTHARKPVRPKTALPEIARQKTLMPERPLSRKSLARKPMRPKTLTPERPNARKPLARKPLRPEDRTTENRSSEIPHAEKTERTFSDKPFISGMKNDPSTHYIHCETSSMPDGRYCVIHLAWINSSRRMPSCCDFRSILIKVGISIQESFLPRRASYENHSS